MEPAAGPQVSSRDEDARPPPSSQPHQQQKPSRYESQKRRDWHTFLQYLANHKPPLPLARCDGAHVVEFLKYLDQFGKTKVHVPGCSYFGQPRPPAPCDCPSRQAWGSLDSLIGRLRAAYNDNAGDRPEANPFGATAVKAHLREVRESQAKARGVAYEKKKRTRSPTGAGEGSWRGEGGTEAASVSGSEAGSSSTDHVRDPPGSSSS